MPVDLPPHPCPSPEGRGSKNPSPRPSPSRGEGGRKPPLSCHFPPLFLSFPASLPVIPASLPVIPASLPVIPASLPVIPASLPVIPASPTWHSAPYLAFPPPPSVIPAPHLLSFPQVLSGNPGSFFLLRGGDFVGGSGFSGSLCHPSPRLGFPINNVGNDSVRNVGNDKKEQAGMTV